MNDRKDVQNRMNVKMLILFFAMLLSFPIGTYSQFCQKLPSVFQTEWVSSKKAGKKQAYNYSNFWKQERNSNFFLSEDDSKLRLAASNTETAIVVEEQEEIFQDLSRFLETRTLKYHSYYKEELS